MRNIKEKEMKKRTITIMTIIMSLLIIGCSERSWTHNAGTVNIEEGLEKAVAKCEQKCIQYKEEIESWTSRVNYETKVTDCIKNECQCYC